MATILNSEKFGARPGAAGLKPKPASINANLIRSLSQDGIDCETNLIEQTLRYAAETEERIAAQTRRIAELETLSVEDSLTGLMNRRGFDRQLDHALKRAKRYGETGILIYCDLDNLKQVNDQFGHSAGDALLKCAAETLEGSIREIDVVGRLGGDEFAVLLTDTGRRDGEKRTQTIQWRLDSAGTIFNSVDIPLLVSLGSEPYGPHDDAETLIHRADMAMYESKRHKQIGKIQSAAE